MVELDAQTAKTQGRLLNLASLEIEKANPSETSSASCLEEGSQSEASSTDACFDVSPGSQNLDQQIRRRPIGMLLRKRVYFEPTWSAETSNGVTKGLNFES